MMVAVSSNRIQRSRSSRIWDIVTAVVLVHISLAALFKFGLPDSFKSHRSDITIELAGSVVRGAGGDGPSQPVPVKSAPVKNVAHPHKLSRPAAIASAQRPLEHTARAVSESQSTVAEAVAGSAAPSVESTPTMDANYSAAYLNNPKPPYPPVAFQMHIEGTVVLKALVLPDGSCANVILARSSGNSLLDQSALTTVGQWKFVPAKAQGKTISQWVNIPIIFSVKRR